MSEIAARDTDAPDLLAVEHAVANLLDALQIQWEDDANLCDTPARVARMWRYEALAGLYHPKPAVVSFPNRCAIDEVYAVGPITVRSCCAHHLVPIQGKAWIAVLPGERLMGLSKFARITQWIMARPQLQEEATHQLADAIEEAIQPLGVAVVVRAAHLCCTWRGVCDGDQLFTTSVMRGSFRQSESARAEVMALFKSQGL